MPLNLKVTLHAFDKWEVNFFKKINPPMRRIGSRYIITAKYYFNRWVEVEPFTNCNMEKTPWFLFENIVTIFWYLKIITRDQGTHFLNKKIAALTKEFQIQHRKSTPYHPQEN